MIKVTLRNPLQQHKTLDYFIQPRDNQLAKDWIVALKQLLSNGLMLEKNFCFLGFPGNARDVDFICNELNEAVDIINRFNFTHTWQNAGLEPYFIEEWFSNESVMYPEEYLVFDKLGGDDKNNPGMQIKHGLMNRLHNHFEVLQGTVESLSSYYRTANIETKYAIRQLNTLCHELENLILAKRKKKTMPEWVRPSQITTWLSAPRYLLTDQHRQLFLENGYDRCFGTVYMHWTQIGKTYFEVWRDEGAPELNETICDAITELKYYSGEFDIEWGQDIKLYNGQSWWDEFIGKYYDWLLSQGVDVTDAKNSLGYLPIGDVLLEKSFGTTDMFEIHNLLEQYLDIYAIEVDGIRAEYPEVWTDNDYKQKQMIRLQSGYEL